MRKLLSLLVITIFLAIFFFPTTSNSNSTGSPGGKTNSPGDLANCSQCHYAGVGTGATITTNIPSTGYVPGNIYTITTNVNQSGINKFGFEITAEESASFAKTGTFLVTNSAETQFANNNTAITHKVGGTSGSNSKSWSMDWLAPGSGTGDVTFYGSYIAANGNGNNTGDTYHSSTLSISEAQSPCNLTGASVYIDYNSAPWMLNASVNGMSMYDYAWTDTNGFLIATANQTIFYTQWCVTITDIITGCDTTICQDCIADSNALCMCTMIYMPVCGCDGVQYANSCLADCADVPWTPAIPNGQLGGWLPCPPVSWDCIQNVCVNPGTGLGQYASLSACLLDSCGITPPVPSWDCIQNICVDPGTGLGQYASLSSCLLDSCGITPPVPSWDCVQNICVDPGTGLGQYASLSACLLDSCAIMPPAPSWDCVQNICVDPGTGLGQYASLSSCLLDSCGITPNVVEERIKNKRLLRVSDFLGREMRGTKNKVLFYIYDDGTVEKRIVIE